MSHSYARRSRLAGLCAVTLCVLSLVGCSNAEPEQAPVSAADQAGSAALLASYESARSAGNWEAAESSADQLRDKYPDSQAAAKLAPGLPQVRTQAAAARELRRLRDLWDYQAVPAGKGVQRSASLYSRTVPAEEGEVAPAPDAQLVLRDHPEWGRSAYLLLAQSRFDCGKPCVLKIRFDQLPAQAFAGKQADSGKGPALFVEDEKLFIAMLSQAQEVRIQLPKGSGAVGSLVFEVGGYEPVRFEKP
jgi:hypothetical protein